VFWGLFKNVQMQGAQALRNEAYFYSYAAMTKGAAQHSRPWCPLGYERIVKPSAFSGNEDYQL
jgi:hypothetical protein